MKKHLFKRLALLTMASLLVLGTIIPAGAAYAAPAAADIGARIDKTPVGSRVTIDGKSWIVLTKQQDYALLFIYGNDYGRTQFRADGQAAFLGGNTLQAAMDAAYKSTSEMKSIAVVPNLALQGNPGTPSGNPTHPSVYSGYTSTLAGSRTNSIFFALSHYDVNHYEWQIPGGYPTINGAKNSWWMRSYNLHVGLNMNIYAMYGMPTHYHQYTTTEQLRYTAPAVWVKYKGHTPPPPTTYNVTYNPNGGSGSARTYAVNANSNHLVSDQGYTRSGYTFANWNTRADGLGTSYANGSYLSVTGNITLYAQWKYNTPTTATVTYSPNGGSGSARSYTVNLNTYHQVSNQGYTRSGYEFRYWNTQADGRGTSYANGSNIYVTGNVTLYAQWGFKGPDIVTITYDPNGGVGNPYSVKYYYNNYFAIQNQGYTRPGYTFDGWNTAADGSGTPYQNGDGFRTIADVTLYAQWKLDVTYSVTYNAGDGTGGSVDSGLVPGSNYTVKSAAQAGVSRSSYEFTYWSLTSNGNGARYNPGNTIEITGDVVLYANWQRVD
ncbi:MAG: InlB B-repeat-containing protein [Oscillospiraceae bacterium]|nr:InlB B-repeat-containing protein [Oscillospiraceae bacterium]